VGRRQRLAAAFDGDTTEREIRRPSTLHLPNPTITNSAAERARNNRLEDNNSEFSRC
jgi:hypothetical protein